MNIINILFYLLGAHALADFVFQNDAMAINKNRNAKTELQRHVPWYYWLLSHSLVHGLGVALITQSAILGVLETICHFTIDFFKCEKVYSIHMDQYLHILCKIIWTVIFYSTR